MMGSALQRRMPLRQATGDAVDGVEVHLGTDPEDLPLEYRPAPASGAHRLTTTGKKRR